MVPMIRCGDYRLARTDCTGPVTSIPAVTSDYLPTVLDMLGLWDDGEAIKQPMDGAWGLLPLFTGEMTQRPKPTGFLTDRDTRALIDNDYKTHSIARQKTDT